MRTKSLKHFFNLIEVTMAVAIVGIGIAGVMALLPPAIEANKSADYNNYTGDVVSTLAAYIDSELRRDWATISNNIPASAATDTQLRFSPEHDDSNKEESARRWKSIPGLNGLYKIHESASAANPIPGLYGVKSSDESVRANISVWKEPSVDNTITLQYHDPDTGAKSTALPGIRVTFELSYPAGVPLEQRTRKQFVYEFYQQQ